MVDHVNTVNEEVCQGSIRDVFVFVLHATKLITTYGEPNRTFEVGQMFKGWFTIDPLPQPSVMSFNQADI